ncbi:hypothetical protein [Okeania sp. SIO2B3]|uniref:hypothetical protein n=1 Tax=Okeania sp. SIO2B3 TaxID=2607784 RepID=UPI0013BEF65D|nr:hypothetical protein [Okeania sp. SIO2B3]NET45925.1 hypothetical protein [Okeania sp. SIO2B3]
MRIKLFFTYLLTSTTVFTSILPAYAQPNTWIDRGTLSRDHRAYCSDIVAQDVQNDVVSFSQNDIGSQSSSNSRSRMQSSNRTTNKGGKGRLKLGRFSIGGGRQRSQNHARRTANQSNSSSNSSQDHSFQYSHDRTITTSSTAGKNCDAFVQGAAHIEATSINAETNRKAIEAKERVRLEEIEAQKQMAIFEHHMQGW